MSTVWLGVNRNKLLSNWFDSTGHRSPRFTNSVSMHGVCWDVRLIERSSVIVTWCLGAVVSVALVIERQGIGVSICQGIKVSGVPGCLSVRVSGCLSV